MKRVLLTFIACGSLVAAIAFADEVRISGTPASVFNVSSTLVKCCNNALDAGGTGPGRKLAFQVRDGGTVYYRASCGPKADGGVVCPIDAGLGDTTVSFSNNSDPYKVDMPANMDRICFGGVSTDNQTVDCLERR